MGPSAPFDKKTALAQCKTPWGMRRFGITTGICQPMPLCYRGSHYRKKSNMNFLFCQENFYRKFDSCVFFVVLPKESGRFLIRLSPNCHAFKRKTGDHLKSFPATPVAVKSADRGACPASPEYHRGISISIPLTAPGYSSKK